MEDRELLREYLERQSERAFAELVARHVNLVFSTALRVVHEPQMAQEVAFILLARKGKSVRDPSAVGGWLYRAASNNAANALRTKQRRHQREGEPLNRAELDAEDHGTWEAIGSLLDSIFLALRIWRWAAAWRKTNPNRGSARGIRVNHCKTVASVRMGEAKGPV